MLKNKVIVFGKESDHLSSVIQENGFVIVPKNPDFVISFGGDGTVMRSEAKYPEIPKIILKNSKICKLCLDLENDEILKRVASGKYKIKTYPKLVCQFKNKKLLAINDIIVHNSDPRHAMRYKLTINEKRCTHEIIGDGIVVATPLGSTGYYRSITDSFFELGMGIAFNNSTEQSDHMVLKEDSKIELEVTRGPVIIFADNQDNNITLKTGDVVVIKKSDTTAKMISVE